MYRIELVRPKEKGKALLVLAISLCLKMESDCIKKVLYGRLDAMKLQASSTAVRPNSLYRHNAFYHRVLSRSDDARNFHCLQCIVLLVLTSKDMHVLQ